MQLLVVEDDARLGRTLRRLLEDDRHVVEVAGDGASGLEVAASWPGLEAIVLDIGLPDMSGLDVYCPGCRDLVKLSRRSPQKRIAGWCRPCNRGVGP